MTRRKKSKERSAGEQQKIEFDKKYSPLWTNKTARYFIITGGRGSGKSFAVGSFICTDFVNKEEQKNTLYLRQTLVSAHISIIPEFLGKLELLGYGEFVKKGKTEIKNLNNLSMLYFRGIQTSRGSNEANLKSITNVSCVLIDEAQELVDEAQFDRIDLSVRDNEVQNRIILSLNPTNDKHWIYRRFFKERGILEDFNGCDPRFPDTCYIHTDFRDNLENLPQTFLDLASECKQQNISKYNNIFLGLWSKDNVDALWKRATMIDPFRLHRRDCPSDFDRIVIGIDPAVTNTEKSDETGIVCVACAKNAHTNETEYYVLEDWSMKGSPDEWARKAIELFNEYDADRIVVEVNNGGDLVESLMHRIDNTVPLTSVRATRGKILRAEPVSALYERGLVHHVGTFPYLEDEMCNYCGTDKESSPDRLDALVWALTDLSGISTSEAQEGTFIRSW